MPRPATGIDLDLARRHHPLMVSGWDRQPPEPHYEPDFGLGGRLLVLFLVIVALVVALAPLFI
jgi:hypothetical protein